MWNRYRGKQKKQIWKTAVKILSVLVLTWVVLLHYPTNHPAYATGVSPTPIAVYGQGGSFSSATANNGGLGTHSLSGPIGLALDSSGGLYVADTANNRVLYFPAGSTTATRVYGQGGSFSSNTANNGGISANSLSGPSGLALDSSDGLYVSDSSNNRVLYYASGSTTATRVYGQASSFSSSTANYPLGVISDASLNQPKDLALDSGGDLYVADTANNRVLYYASGSTIATRVYGQGGSGINLTSGTANNGGISATSLNSPSGLALDSSGNLYVADATNNRVLYYASGSVTATRVYGQAGSFSSGTANNGGISPTSLSSPYGAKLDSSNNLYVADNLNHRVLYYPSGSTTATRVYGQGGSFSSGSVNNGSGGATSAGGLDKPVGIAINNSSGDIYICDSLNNRILKFRTSLSVTTQPPASTPANSAFSTSASLIDVGSSTVFTDFKGTVTVQIKSGTGAAGATLSGTTTVSAVRGATTFSGLSLNLSSTSYILTFSSPGVGSVNTNPSTIASGVGFVNTNLSNSGSLIMTPGTSPSFTLTLSGSSSVTKTAQWTFRVQDTTASGWHLALTSTQFSTAGGYTLPTDVTTITSVSADCTSGQTCVSPTNSIGYPLTVPAAATTAPSPVTFYNAASGTGTGDVTVTAAFLLTVPAGSAAGTYTSTFTLTIASGS